VETVDELLYQLDAASEFIDSSQLGISPQCGFSSTVLGNDLEEPQQWAKLERAVATAERYWGQS
jgi:5-methyltetrahydropteroyltriglutamate--homocysteine methyltransferase